MASSAPPQKDTAHAALPAPSTSALESQKIKKLESQISSLEAEIVHVNAQEAEIRAQLKSPSPPSATVQRHIRLLHAYNETRDMATGLLGIVAENRGVRVRDVYEEYGVEEGT